MSDLVKGFAAIMLGAVFFGLLGVFSRLIGLEFGVFNTNWVRNLIVFLILGIYFLITKKWQVVERTDRKWLVIWPFFGMFTTIGIFVGTNRLPIGSALLFFFSGMIVTIYVVSYVMLKERINLIKLVAIGLVLVGLVVIYRRDLSFGDALGFWAAILGGGGNGVWAVLSKKLSKAYDSFQLVFIDALVSMVFSFTIAMSLGERLQFVGFGRSWLVVFIWAVSSIGVIWSIIYGYKKLEAQKAALLMPMRAVFGALWGYVVYKEVLGIEVFVGGLLILVASILPNVVKSKGASAP